MTVEEINASTFKAHCLALLDRVARTRVELVVTKRGKAVARVVPLEEDGGRKPIEGSVTLQAQADEAYFSTGERWDADQAPR